jgi:hypothetical protein
VDLGEGEDRVGDEVLDDLAEQDRVEGPGRVGQRLGLDVDEVRAERATTAPDASTTS